MSILNKFEEITMWPHLFCYYFVLIIPLMRQTESTLISWISFISSCFTSDSRWGSMADRSMSIAYGGLTPHPSLVVTAQLQSWNKQCTDVPADPIWQTGKWIEKAWLAVKYFRDSKYSTEHWVRQWTVGQKMLIICRYNHGCVKQAWLAHRHHSTTSLDCEGLGSSNSSVISVQLKKKFKFT